MLSQQIYPRCYPPAHFLKSLNGRVAQLVRSHSHSEWYWFDSFHALLQNNTFYSVNLIVFLRKSFCTALAHYITVIFGHVLERATRITLQPYLWQLDVYAILILTVFAHKELDTVIRNAIIIHDSRPISIG